MSQKFLFPTYRYALIICRSKENKFLTVEQKTGKWWIPGGKVQNNQTFQHAAIRQCKEETGININLKGIIRVDYGKFFQKNAWRTVYYAEPIQSSLIGLKTIEDQETKRALFLSIEEIQQLKDKWRGREIYDFPKYLAEGGNYYPFAIFKENFRFDEKMI